MRGNPVATNIAAKSFEELYDQTSSGLLNKTGKESFEAMKILQNAEQQIIRLRTMPHILFQPLGNSLKQIAQLIKMDVGLEVAFAESGGWDTHFNQGTELDVFAEMSVISAMRSQLSGLTSVPIQDDVTCDDNDRIRTYR